MAPLGSAPAQNMHRDSMAQQDDQLPNIQASDTIPLLFMHVSLQGMALESRMMVPLQTSNQHVPWS